MEIIHLVGQILFGGYFVFNGVNHFMKADAMTGYAASMKVPSPKLAVYGAGVLLLLGGLGIIFDTYTFYALIFLVIFLIPVSFMMHPFWKMSDPQMKMANMVNFTKNMALLGAVLMMMY